MGNFVSTPDAAFTPSDAFFLVEATRTGSLDVVRLFLRKNPALVYATDSADASTPWHVAAAAGHDVVLRVLIDTTRANAVSNSFDPLSKVINKQNAKGQTPLMLACGGGHSVCVRLLLESGAHLLVADTAGRSALHYAALHCGSDGVQGNDCVDLLLVDLQQQLVVQGPEKAPPSVHPNVIRKFAETGDMYGRTALHCAAWSGNTRAVHTLWSVGADICARTAVDCYESDLPCNSGTTPLHFAAMRGHQPVVVLLLAAWHRLVTRPSAPLPLGPLAAALAAAAAAAGSLASKVEVGEQAPAGLGDRTPQRSGQEREQDDGREAEGKAGGRGSDAGEAGKVPGDGEGEGKAEATAAVGLPDECGGKGGQEDAGKRVNGDGDTSGRAAAAAVGSHGGSTASIGSAGGRRSRDGAGSCSSDDQAAAAAPLLTLPRIPSTFQAPAPPLGDPRLMVDAYGMTPYTIACKRAGNRGEAGMLIELLDPATDFGAGDDEDSDDNGDGQGGEGDSGGKRDANGAGRGQNSVGGGIANGSSEPGRAEARRAKFGGLHGGDDEDSDNDSDAGEAGPLLLWEGVELIQDIAANPESFFRLQRSVTLLQPLQQPEEGGPGGRGLGAGSARGSRGQLQGRGSGLLGMGGRVSNSGSSSGGGGGGGFGSRNMGAGRRPTVTVTEVVPDCFLCPLTCRVFRDPVVAADGVTYEREAIERHLRLVATSPVTKMRLASKQVYDNTALRRAIEHWREHWREGAGVTAATAAAAAVAVAGATRGPSGDGESR